MGFSDVMLALVLAFGLYTADAVWNANTVRVTVETGDNLEDRGYSSEFLTVLFLSELRDIVDIESVVHAPVVRSSDDQSVVSGLSAMLGLDEATYIVQDLVGLRPTRLRAAVIADSGADDEFRFILDGESPNAPGFRVDLRGGDADVPDLLRRAAARTVREIDPYAAFLHRYVTLAERPAPLTNIDANERRTQLDWALSQIDDELAKLGMVRETAVWRSDLHNLRGLFNLLAAAETSDAEVFVEQAKGDFERALDLNRHFAVARLNLAFTLVHLDRYAEAIDVLTPLVEPWLQFLPGPLMASARNLMAVAEWGRGNLDAAAHHFASAIRAYPHSTATHVYRADMFAQQGKMRAAERDRMRAAENLARFETYPEVAMLYFRLTPADDGPLTRFGRR